MTTRRRTTPVPVGPIHRRLWRTLWRRCSCGLPAPCIDRRLPAPAPPFANRADAPAEPPDLHTPDHLAGGAGSRDTAARPVPALGQGLRVSAAGRTGARRRRETSSMHGGGPAPTPTLGPGRTPTRVEDSRRTRPRPSSLWDNTHWPAPSGAGGAARATTTRHVAQGGVATRRAHVRNPSDGGCGRRGWGSEAGRAGALTPAQRHRASGERS
jgi:hypothetical protein